MSAIFDSEIEAAVNLVRDTLGVLSLAPAEAPPGQQQWTSHQTLDIIFGAESIFGVQFSSEQMEEIQSIETLLSAVKAARNPD